GPDDGKGGPEDARVHVLTPCVKKSPAARKAPPTEPLHNVCTRPPVGRRTAAENGGVLTMNRTGNVGSAAAVLVVLVAGAAGAAPLKEYKVERTKDLAYCEIADDPDAD